MKKVQKKETKYLKEYSEHLISLLKDIDHEGIEKMAEYFIDARLNDATVFFAGNGGSAATASHFSQDLGEVGRKAGTKSFRAISLNDSVPFMTALGNDYGYERIFSGQIENLFRKGDVLVVISASGNSPNVIEAVKEAKRKGGTTIGLVGFDGGKLSKLCDHIVHVPTEKGKYGPVEDMHLLIGHMATTYLIDRGMDK